MTDYIQARIDRALRAEAAMEANIATLELCQEAVVELERKLYLAGTDLIEVRDQRDAARTERNALRAENEQMRAALREIAIADAPNADWGGEFRDYDGLTVASTLAAIAKATLQESE